MALQLINNIIENKYNTLNQIIHDIDELKNYLNIITESGDVLIEIEDQSKQEEGQSEQSEQSEQSQQSQLLNDQYSQENINLLPLLLLLDEEKTESNQSLLPLLLLLD